MLHVVVAVHQDDWKLISDMLMKWGYIEVYSVDSTIDCRCNDPPIYLSIHVIRYRSMCVHYNDVAYSLLIVYPCNVTKEICVESVVR
jgi:hypothetical protein